MVKVSRVFLLIYIFLLSVLNSSAADMTIDFDGEGGSQVVVGEDSGKESEHGDCVGACGDGTGGYGYDYDDDGHGYADDSWERADVADYDRSDEYSESSSGEVGNNWEEVRRESVARREARVLNHYSRKIVTFDRDRGDGLIFIRDEKGNIYYRGTDRRSRGGKNHTDIYFAEMTNEPFVKSKDGRSVLRLQVLEYCAYDGTCGQKGFREDWWSHSREPYFEGANNWQDVVEFNQDRLNLDRGIERALKNPQISGNPSKVKVLSEAKRLSDDAVKELKKNNVMEALDLQFAAGGLASTVIDLGLSFTPGVGWAKAAYELIGGTRLIDGQPLSALERLMAGIEVSMPGVGWLAVAGLKIISRNPIFKRGASAVAKDVVEIEKIIEKLKPIRFKSGTNLSEIAVIGRSMPEVLDAAARLNYGGVKVRIFEPSRAAELNLVELVKEKGGKFLSYDEIPATMMYRENMDWIRQIQRDDISVLDIGNPRNIVEKSRFYDDEVFRLFGEVK